MQVALADDLGIFIKFSLSSLFSLLQSSNQEVGNTVKAGLKSLIPTLEKNKNTSKGVEMLLEKLSV